MLLLLAPRPTLLLLLLRPALLLSLMLLGNLANLHPPRVLGSPVLPALTAPMAVDAAEVAISVEPLRASAFAAAESAATPSFASRSAALVSLARAFYQLLAAISPCRNDPCGGS